MDNDELIDIEGMQLVNETYDWRRVRTPGICFNVDWGRVWLNSSCRMILASKLIEIKIRTSDGMVAMRGVQEEGPGVVRMGADNQIQRPHVIRAITALGYTGEWKYTAKVHKRVLYFNPAWYVAKQEGLADWAHSPNKGKKPNTVESIQRTARISSTRVQRKRAELRRRHERVEANFTELLDGKIATTKTTSTRNARPHATRSEPAQGSSGDLRGRAGAPEAGDTRAAGDKPGPGGGGMDL